MLGRGQPRGAAGPRVPEALSAGQGQTPPSGRHALAAHRLRGKTQAWFAREAGRWTTA
jgi:hypothetical protein